MLLKKKDKNFIVLLQYKYPSNIPRSLQATGTCKYISVTDPNLELHVRGEAGEACAACFSSSDLRYFFPLPKIREGGPQAPPLDPATAYNI